MIVTLLISFDENKQNKFQTPSQKVVYHAYVSSFAERSVLNAVTNFGMIFVFMLVVSKIVSIS